MEKIGTKFISRLVRPKSSKNVGNGQTNKAEMNL